MTLRWSGLAAACLAAAIAHVALLAAADALPSKLSDEEFWRIVSTFSERPGTFNSDNLLSNETALQSVIPELERDLKPGGVYLGVGPEQNFTYIRALEPRMAFIFDIRRGNVALRLI